MKLRALCSRADLLEVLCKHDVKTARKLGKNLGYEWEEPTFKIDDEAEANKKKQTDLANVSEKEANKETIKLYQAPLIDLPFWIVSSYSYVAEEIKQKSDSDRSQKENAYQGWTDRPQHLPQHHLLSPWCELESRLRRHLITKKTSHSIDIDLAIRQICKGLTLVEIPHKRRRSWVRRGFRD